jgi:PAS domain S-box-containing protein
MLNHNGEHLLLEDWPRAFGLHQPDMVTPYRVSELPVLRALQGERAQDVEMIIRHEESEAARSISMASWPIIGADGSIEGAIVIFTNPSPVKQLEESRERYIQRTEVLYRLSNIITASGSNLGKLLKSVSILVAKTLGDMASITLLNQAQEKLHIAAAYDTDSTARAMLRKVIEQAADLDRSQGLVAKAINTGQPILIPHIPIEELRAVSLPIWQEFVDYAGIESILVVPMIGRNGTVGALSVARHIGNGAFSSADQSFVSEIATRTALAVEYSRLFESLRAEVMARKSAHKALDVSEGRFRAIFEATALGIKILDLDGNILQTNAAFESMLGRAEHELVGGHFTEFVDPADRPAAREIFHEIKVNRAPFLRFEHRGIHADGSLVWMKTIFTPVKNIKTDGKNGSAVFIVGIIENITEQKKIQSELAEMSNRLQGSVELERLRLAQELHDNPMQTLYTAIYQIEELKNKSNPQMKEALENVNQDIKSVLDGLRATAKELRPPTLFSFGLEHAIRSHVDDIRDKYPNIKVLLSLAHDRQLLPEKARLALFRVAQQSLANVLRHAEATEVKVRFSFDAEEVRLEIADNGKGFEVPDNWIGLVRSGHYGLAGAAERIHALGGTLTVKSELGHSTVVIAAIPWRNLQD